MSEDIKFWITTAISLATLIFAFWQYKAKKEEEKKVEALKILLGTVKGWREYIQSAANANTLLRNHTRGTTDEGESVKKFSSLDDIESVVEINGAYLNGLHIVAERQLEEINKILKDK